MQHVLNTFLLSVFVFVLTVQGAFALGSIESTKQRLTQLYTMGLQVQSQAQARQLAGEITKTYDCLMYKIAARNGAREVQGVHISEANRILMGIVGNIANTPSKQQAFQRYGQWVNSMVFELPDNKLETYKAHCY